MNTCEKPKCRKTRCKDGFVFRLVTIPAALGDDKTGQDIPENGAYTNSLVRYLANGAQYIYDSDGVYTPIEADLSEVYEQLDEETAARVAADAALQERLDALPDTYYNRWEVDALIQQEIGNIETALRTINTGSGV